MTFQRLHLSPSNKSWLFAWLLIVSLGCPSHGYAFSSVENADFIAMEDAVGEESIPLLPVVQRLRTLALVLMGVALCFAAILSTWGKTGPALGVGLGTLILSGGIWILSLLWQPFGQTTERFPKPLGEYADLHSQSGQSGLDVLIRKVGRECVRIAMRATIPFVLIQGLWIALTVSFSGADEETFSRYLLGSLLALSSTMIGHLFLFVF